MNTRLVSRTIMLALMIAAIGLAGWSGGSGVAAAPVPAPGARPPAQSAGAFLSVWSRTDLPVAQTKVARGWVWGPTPTITRLEPWAESPSGQRTVQYWDKARMEITYPSANPNDPYYVTNGRLVYEMVGGLIQTGNNQFTPKTASQEPVAGDTRSANPDAPSYLVMRFRASIYPGENVFSDRTGQAITAYMDNRGVTNRADFLAGYGVKYGHYAGETQHNIADKFWSFLNQQGLVYENGVFRTGTLFNWVAVTGYPISEPYWITIRVGGRQYAALIQLFERRTITYVPLFPADYQVQMGNVGQHYYNWRYSTP